MPGGRKPDPIWDLGDSKKIAMPKANNTQAMGKGFECMNCGLKQRTQDVARVIAHHTCDKGICLLNSMGTPCEESKTTPDPQSTT